MQPRRRTSGLDPNQSSTTARRALAATPFRYTRRVPAMWIIPAGVMKAMAAGLPPNTTHQVGSSSTTHRIHRRRSRRLEWGIVSSNVSVLTLCSQFSM